MKIIPALYLPIYEELIQKCRSIYKYFLTLSSFLVWEQLKMGKSREFTNSK